MAKPVREKHLPRVLPCSQRDTDCSEKCPSPVVSSSSHCWGGEKSTCCLSWATAKPLLIHLDGGDRSVRSSKLPNYKTGQILDGKNSPQYQCDSKSLFKILK